MQKYINNDLRSSYQTSKVALNEDKTVEWNSIGLFTFDNMFSSLRNIIEEILINLV